MSVEILPNAAQLQYVRKIPLETLAIGEWPWRSLKVIGIAAIR